MANMYTFQRSGFDVRLNTLDIKYFEFFLVSYVVLKQMDTFL